MKIIELDGGNWRTVLDFYHALLPALGAPDWHSEGINAAIDSMIWGGINSVSPPYRVRVLNAHKLPSTIRREIEALAAAIVAHRADHRHMHGRDVDVEVELAGPQSAPP